MEYPDSPASSGESDSDAFNTTLARIHFGPVTSPEKRFIEARPDLLKPVPVRSSPLRRSPRLSSPLPSEFTPDSPKSAVRNEEEAGSEEENGDASRPETPDNDRSAEDGAYLTI